MTGPADRSTVVRKLADDDAREAVDRLLERDRIRTRFVSMIGHDLTGLLGSMSMRLGVVEQVGRVGSVPFDLVLPLRGVIERCHRLVCDLRTIGKVVTDELRLEKAVCDLREEIDRAVAEFHGFHQDKRLDLKVRAPERLPAFVDAIMIQQVLYNLLRNAAQATPAGGAITIMARSDRKSLTVEVSDTGIGIDPGSVERVFEPYVRLSTTTPGSGLGLHICRRIVESHDGAISCRSDGPGRGASFIMTLPTTQPPVTDEASEGCA